MELTVLNVVSWLALSSSIFLYLSGGSTCLFIIRKQSVGHIPLFPYIATCVSSTIWLKYGFIQNNGTIKVVNSIGSLLQVVYICVYYMYCHEKRRVNLTIFGSAMFLYCTLFYAKYLAISDSVAATHLGLIGTFLSIVMTASPLITVSEIIRTKCTSSMAFPFVFVCFISCILWALFGFLIHDTFIVIPNAVGIALGLFQLSFFLIYPAKRQETTKASIALPLQEAWFVFLEFAFVYMGYFTTVNLLEVLGSQNYQEPIAVWLVWFVTHGILDRHISIYRFSN